MNFLHFEGWYLWLFGLGIFSIHLKADYSFLMSLPLRKQTELVMSKVLSTGHFQAWLTGSQTNIWNIWKLIKKKSDNELHIFQYDARLLSETPSILHYSVTPWFLVSLSRNGIFEHGWYNKQLVSKILTFTSSMTRYNSVGMSISSIRSTILGCLTRLKIDTSFWIMCSWHTKKSSMNVG